MIEGNAAPELVRTRPFTEFPFCADAAAERRPRTSAASAAMRAIWYIEKTPEGGRMRAAKRYHRTAKGVDRPLYLCKNRELCRQPNEIRGRPERAYSDRSRRAGVANGGPRRS